MAKGGGNITPERHRRPHQRGPHQLHAGTEEGGQVDIRPPTPPSVAHDPADPTAALPDASASPTARSHEAGSNASRVVGSGSEKPPPDLQRQHGIVAPGYLEEGGAA